MMKRSKPKILVAVMSYERPDALEVCLTSLVEVGGEFSVVIVDDRSSNKSIPDLADRFGFEFFVGPGGTGRHGGLYNNMELAKKIAERRGFDYIAFFQDDMQLVRPFDETVILEYEKVFANDRNVVCIDHRFSRAGFNAIFDHELNAYRYPNKYTYSDVGVFSLRRLSERNFSFNQFSHSFIATEKLIKKSAKEINMVKVSARTPICMHIPFPRLIRNKIPLPRLSRISKKTRQYKTMTPNAIRKMDDRDPSEAPNFRKFLEFSNLSALDRWLINRSSDSKIF